MHDLPLITTIAAAFGLAIGEHELALGMSRRVIGPVARGAKA